MKLENRSSLGDLVVAVYDAAGAVSKDERAASYLAACAIGRLLHQVGRLDLARRLAEQN